MSLRAILHSVRDALIRITTKIRSSVATVKAKARRRAGPKGNTPTPPPTPSGILQPSPTHLTFSPQDHSRLFTRLPLEVRRKIYDHLWATYLASSPLTPDAGKPRLHIYTDGLDDTNDNLTHTRCLGHSLALDGSGVRQSTPAGGPWPFVAAPGPPPTAAAGANNSNAVGQLVGMPPVWFWFALGMQMHWGRHADCQAAVMARWDRQTGRNEAFAPFLLVFLVCKRMYEEAIDSFFSTVTLVFTSSQDAYRFFVCAPHPFLTSLLSLELSFATTVSDPLFLHKLLEEWSDDDDEVLPSSPGPAGPSAPTTPTGNHVCVTKPCRPTSFGEELWHELIQAIRVRAPRLKDLEITIGGALDESVVLSEFDGRAVDEERIVEEDAGNTPWVLPGTVIVDFSSGRGKRFVQRGGRMALAKNRLSF